MNSTGFLTTLWDFACRKCTVWGSGPPCLRPPTPLGGSAGLQGMGVPSTSAHLRDCCFLTTGRGSSRGQEWLENSPCFFYFHLQWRECEQWARRGGDGLPLRGVREGGPHFRVKCQPRADTPGQSLLLSPDAHLQGAVDCHWIPGDLIPLSLKITIGRSETWLWIRLTCENS